jgi:hypothetical protein
MKIKIIKCSDKEYWYNKYINSNFEVLRTTVLGSLFVVDNDGRENYILAEDCKEVNESENYDEYNDKLISKAPQLAEALKYVMNKICTDCDDSTGKYCNVVDCYFYNYVKLLESIEPDQKDYNNDPEGSEVFDN